jgi:hypothetical protein
LRQRVAKLTAHALDPPAIRTDFLNAIPAPQRKHLLHLLVEKVLIRDSCKFEVWYRIRQFAAVRTLSHLVVHRLQNANLCRKSPKCPLTRAISLLDAGPPPDRETPQGPARVVELEVGTVPTLPIRAPQARPTGSAVAAG